MADFDRLMPVNCLSSLLTDQRVAPEIRKVGAGSIINLSSVGGLFALPSVRAYCTSRAAGVVFLASDESSFTTAAVSPVEPGHAAW